MKRFVLLVLVLGAAASGSYYLATGRLPWVFLSAEEQRVLDLREELGRIRQQWQQAGRAQVFSTSADTGSLADGPLERLDKLDQSLADLIPRLKTPDARNQAGSLRRDIASFRNEMR